MRCRYETVPPAFGRHERIGKEIHNPRSRRETSVYIRRYTGDSASQSGRSDGSDIISIGRERNVNAQLVRSGKAEKNGRRQLTGVRVFEMAARESGRIKDAYQKRVLDDAARKRRQKKALEALEQDNFHDDPHADLVMSKKVPKFQETLDSRDVGRKKKTRSAEYYKQRFRKTFAQLVEEDLNVNPNAPNYACAQVPQSRLPDRHFCAVCGFPSNYTCIPCGARYCCVKCLGTHLDTRCLKWTA